MNASFNFRSSFDVLVITDRLIRVILRVLFVINIEYSEDQKRMRKNKRISRHDDQTIIHHVTMSHSITQYVIVFNGHF